jgi:hypothetical protein
MRNLYILCDRKEVQSGIVEKSSAEGREKGYFIEVEEMIGHENN